MALDVLSRRGQQVVEASRAGLTFNPVGVVAFPGGTGTADMVRQAKAKGVNVWEPVKC